VKKNPYWFFQKWGVDEPSPLEVLEQKVKELEDRVHLLEQESVEQSNSMYECLNSIEARIDILTAERLENFNLGGK
jgi:TolA-binding protein